MIKNFKWNQFTDVPISAVEMFILNVRTMFNFIVYCYELLNILFAKYFLFFIVNYYLFVIVISSIRVVIF